MFDLPVVAHARARPIPAVWRAKMQSSNISVGPQRQVPDAFEFAKALAIISANVAAYDKVPHVRSVPAGSRAPAASSSEPTDTTPAAVARACKDASTTILYEDSDASYRPSAAL